MKAANKRFAYGVSICKDGHSLRSRAGHCIVYNPARIAFSRRHGEARFVYIAATLHKELIKIGSCEDIIGRERSLRKSNYGGASDWSIIAHAECERAGEVEVEAQRISERYVVTADYQRDGRQ
jgi:hypothetical protein